MTSVDFIELAISIYSNCGFELVTATLGLTFPQPEGSY
jgi:hypothetical protein